MLPPNGELIEVCAVRVGVLLDICHHDRAMNGGRIPHDPPSLAETVHYLPFLGQANVLNWHTWTCGPSTPPRCWVTTRPSCASPGSAVAGRRPSWVGGPTCLERWYLASKRVTGRYGMSNCVADWLMLSTCRLKYSVYMPLVGLGWRH